MWRTSSIRTTIMVLVFGSQAGSNPSAISTPPWAASLDATVRVPAGGAERHSNA